MTDIERQIRDAVTEGYLETGEWLSATDIAEHLEWSSSKVRRVIDAAHGAVEGTRAYHDSRPSHSRSYPGMGPVNSHRVWVYGPTLGHLRDLLLSSRARVDG